MNWLSWADLIETVAGAGLSLFLSLNLTGILTRQGLHRTHRLYICLALLCALTMTGLIYAAAFTFGWIAGLVVFVLTAVLAALGFLKNLRLLPPPEDILFFGDPKQKKAVRIRLVFLGAGYGLLAVFVWTFPFLSGHLSIFLLLIAAAILYTVLSRMLAFDLAAQASAIVDRQYQTELISFMQVIRSQRHDFNFHMQAIAGMIENKDYDQCDEYIRSMVKKAEVMNDLLPIAHPAVSAVLCSFREIADQKGITMTLDIEDNLAHIPCSVYETNTIIGNLIQNAIDETETHTKDNAWIHVLLLKRGGIYTIKVTNPCEADPTRFQHCFQPGVSTKQAHEGIGLATVSRIVRRYHGHAFLEMGDGTVSFLAQLAGSIAT